MFTLSVSELGSNGVKVPSLRVFAGTLDNATATNYTRVHAAEMARRVKGFALLKSCFPSSQAENPMTTFLIRLTQKMALIFWLSLAPEPLLAANNAFNNSNWISTGGIPGASGDVYASVVDNSGNLYIGGNFTMVGDVFATNIAKWDGSSWAAVGSGLNATVRALAVSSGALYVGGAFTDAGGSNVNHIAKWDGSYWSALGSGMSGSTVHALAISGNDLYAGGYGSFTTTDGNTANVAKWDGSNWSALGSGTDSAVYSLAVIGSDLYAGGVFRTAGGSNVDHIAKWNGTSWSALASGVSAIRIIPIVHSLAASGSDLYAGGSFTMAGGITVNGTAKWDGTRWSALGSGVTYRNPTTPIVLTLTVSEGDLYAGGRFTTAGGNPANNFATWDGNGWSAGGSGMSYGGGPNTVMALTVSGSHIYAGGRFVAVGETASTNVSKWDGSNWSPVGSGLNAQVNALAVDRNNLYAGGAFTYSGANPINRIAKWDESNWSDLGLGLNAPVNALAVSGNELYVGGSFTDAGGDNANCIAKWNGSRWSALGSGLDGAVNALAISGSCLFAGGSFTSAGGTNVNRIAKWNGSSWSALGSGLDGPVNALAICGSNLFVGGSFTNAGGNNVNRIARWNGNSWSALGSGMDGPVSALAVVGSDLFAGGQFRTANGSNVYFIAKWDGSSWSALGSGLNSHASALSTVGSALYVGGNFTTAGGKVSMHMAWAHLELPSLSLLRTGNDVTLSWPTFYETFVLQQAADVAGSNSWSNANYPLTTNRGIKSATVPIAPSNKFFRLIGN